MMSAAATPASAPTHCATVYAQASRQLRPPCEASANDTAGLKCAPEIGPKVRINATSVAPVAIVLASSAMATLPPARRSPMIPEPTTVANRSPVPSPSATSLRDGDGLSSAEAWRVIGCSGLAAGGVTARARLARPDERARESTVDVGRDSIGVQSALGQERARVFDLINAPRLQLHIGKASGAQLGGVVVLLQRTGNAADPQFHAAANIGGHVATDDDVGHGEAAAGFEHAKGFAQHGVLVAGQIDDTVGDDHVDRVVRQRDVLDGAFEEFDIRRAGLALILACEGEHLVGHVQAEDFAGGADTLRR